MYIIKIPSDRSMPLQYLIQKLFLHIKRAHLKGCRGRKSNMLKTRQIGFEVIIYPRGRIDNHEGKSLETDITRFLEEKPDVNIVMNLKDVEYLSSSGIRIFLTTQRLLKGRKSSLKLCCLQPAVLKLLDAAKLSEHFQIYETEEAALAL